MIALPKVKLQAPYLYLLAATAGLSVLLMAGRLVYLPVIATIRDRHVALTELRVKMADVHRITEELPRQKLAVRKITERYAVLQRRLGQGQSVARILEQLNGVAKSKRVQLIATQSSAEQVTERNVNIGSEITLREIPLAVQVTGRYRQVAEFLGALDEAPFVASVRRLSLTRPERENPQLHADLLVAVYIANRMPNP